MVAEIITEINNTSRNIVSAMEMEKPTSPSSDLLQVYGLSKAELIRGMAKMAIPRYRKHRYIIIL
jgi:hypothetical protein